MSITSSFTDWRGSDVPLAARVPRARRQQRRELASALGLGEAPTWARIVVTRVHDSRAPIV